MTPGILSCGQLDPWGVSADKIHDRHDSVETGRGLLRVVRTRKEFAAGRSCEG